MERDTFLTRVGQASLATTLPDPPQVSRDLPELGDVDLVDLLRARVQAVNGVMHGPVTRHGASRAVAGIATGHDAKSFMAWDDLLASGVASALQSAGMERVDHHVPLEERLEHNLSYLDLDVGVTGADAALAESGTLVLTHGKGRPRMASLAPEIHIALLEVSFIERTLAHWAHENPRLAGETTNLVFVSGPSRTGDIEQQLNLGVHGPRHLHVVMIK
ncbi:MAG: lactate utilization protein C [Actinomycetota bacterium]